jgi:hypothetical protein
VRLPAELFTRNPLASSDRTNLNQCKFEVMSPCLLPARLRSFCGSRSRAPGPPVHDATASSSTAGSSALRVLSATWKLSFFRDLTFALVWDLFVKAAWVLLGLCESNYLSDDDGVRRPMMAKIFGGAETWLVLIYSCRVV